MFNQVAKQLKQPKGFLGKLLSKFLKRMNNRIYVQIVEDINAQNGDKIFEIGYGHGDGVFRLSNNAICLVDGIDYSEVMFKAASRLNKRHIKDGRVELTFGNFLNSTLKSNYYNKVFCVNVIYFWDDLNAPFQKVKKSLINNGNFWIYMDSEEEIKNSKFTNSSNFNSYSIDRVIDQLQNNGFETEYYDFARGHIIKAALN